MGRMKLKRDGSKMLHADVEVAPPAGSLAALFEKFSCGVCTFGIRGEKTISKRAQCYLWSLKIRIIRDWRL